MVKRKVEAVTSVSAVATLKSVPLAASNFATGPTKRQKLKHSVSNISSEAQFGGVDVTALETKSENSESESEKAGEEYDSSNSELSTIPKTLNNVLSNFNFIKGVVGETSDEWTIRLDGTDKVTLIGQYDLWVRRGLVSVLGAELHPSSSIHRIYAPSTHSLPCIQPILDKSASKHEPAEITVLPCCTRLRMLRQLSPKFGKIWNRKPVVAEEASNVDRSQRSFVFLQSSANDPYERPLRLLEPSPYWQFAMSQMRYKQSKQQLKVMICGPKGSGKSSFCRLLANSILTTKLDTTRKSDIYPSVDHNGTDGIAYLDLDPGQPEFSPPGEVSLVHMRACNFGVPYSHPMIVSSEGNKLIRAHHIGYLSPKDDPDHYLKCALDLYARYKLLNSQYPSCALIINTSGWIQGSGLEVLTELIRLIALTDVLYLSLSGPTEVTETLTNVTLRAGIPFQQLASPEPGISTRTASDFRIMQTMSYFHLDEPEGEFLRWNASPLTETPPLTVRYAGATQDIFAIMVLGDKLEPKNLACILEGCVVGLVAIEDDLILPREKDEVVYGNHAGLDKDQERVADPQDAAPLHLEPRKRKGSFSSSDDEPGPTARNHFPFESKGEMALFLASPTHHEEIRSGSEVDHASILRTPEDLPYLSPPSGAQTALNPSKSYSLGQALIRGINAATKTLHLITPIPPATFHALGRQNTKIVLVRGRLGSPTWAYREEYALAAARRRRIKKLNGAVEGFGKEEARAWAEGTPWASVDLGRAGSHGAKVWRVRRDLKGRGEEKEE